MNDYAHLDGDEDTIPPGLESRSSTLRVAFDLVWASGRRYVIVILGAMLAAAAALSFQLLVGREILELLADSDDVDAGDLAPSIAMLGALLMVSAIAEAVTREYRLPLSELVERRATDDILDVATETEYEAFEYPAFHDRLERALHGAGQESTAVVFGLISLLSTLMITVGVTAVLITVVPVLVPITVLGFIPIAAVNLINNRAMYRLEYELTENERERGYLEDVMTYRENAKEVRSYGLAPTFRGWHGALWDTRIDLVKAIVKRRLTLLTVGSMITTAVLIGTLAFTLVLAGRGSISLGDAAVAIVGLQQLSGRLLSAGSALSGVHEAVIFLRDFEHFRDSLPARVAPTAATQPPESPDRLTVEGLGYRYPGAERDALQTVDLELRKGQIMAIVGSNGSGKSTLAKILCGLLPAQRGVVRWDDMDLAGCDPVAMRSRIAPVFQDYTRFNFALGRAVGLGDTSRLGDDDAIEATIRRAGIGRLIDDHSDGLQTRLGKEYTDGIDVSIGQWQRIAIARALFRDAPVLVFDEPSASLDPHAEAELFELLHAACADKMVVFISHRFATVRGADVVLVLDQGEVVETGSHDELMQARGLYADMFEIQASRFGV